MKWQDAAFSPHRLPARDFSYGLDPVGKGHAAAGLSAVLAPGAAAVDGAAAGAPSFAAGLAGLDALFFFAFFLVGAFLPAALRATFFFAVFFFVADAFFFFFPPFLAFFFVAMVYLLVKVAQRSPARRAGLFSRRPGCARAGN